MSKKVKLAFDSPGKWDSTWIREIVNGKMVVTQIAKGDVLEVDLDEKSVRTESLKRHIERGVCRVVKATPPLVAASKEV